MAFIGNEVISQVLDRCDIVALISSHIPLKRAGRNFKACCPFHNEKTPSFIVNPDKQIFHCFGCGAGGNSISFVMQQERLEFPAAIRLLAEKAGVTIPEQSGEHSKTTHIRQQLKKVNEAAAQYFCHNLIFGKAKAADAARAYLKKRDITPEMAKTFRLGFALEGWDGLINHLKDKNVSLSMMEKAGLIIAKSGGNGFYDRFRNRIMFPVLDAQGKCIAFGGRTMEEDNPAKYMNSPETPVYTKGRHLYGFSWAKEAIGRQDFAIVVEGYTDFIMPFDAGVKNIVASSGTALTVEQIRLLRRYTHNVVMLFDRDQAGEAATLRSLDLLVEEGMSVKVATLTLPSAKVKKDAQAKDDPDSFLRRYGAQEFNKRISEAQPLFEFKLNILRQRYDGRTVEGRAHISGEMLPTISKFQNEIVKSEYIKRLAQALVISQDALLAELKKIEKEGTSARQIRRADTGKETKISDAPIRPIERHLLKLMLEESEFIPLTKAQARLSDFKNKEVRSIVSKIFELFEQGQEANVGGLMNSCDDPKMLRTMSSLMASEDLLTGDRQKIHSDCLHRLKNDRLKSQRRHILHEMETARDTGNKSRLDELTKEFNQSLKE